MVAEVVEATDDGRGLNLLGLRGWNEWCWAFSLEYGSCVLSPSLASSSVPLACESFCRWDHWGSDLPTRSIQGSTKGMAVPLHDRKERLFFIQVLQDDLLQFSFSQHILLNFIRSFSK